MSYTKNTWKAGDTITSAKLNNMEDGIAAASDNNGGALIIHIGDEAPYALDKTWREIYDAFMQNPNVYVVLPDPDYGINYAQVVYVHGGDTHYQVDISVPMRSNDVWEYAALYATTTTENGYPVPD